MTPKPLDLRTIDEAARRKFEAAWRAGRPEPIEGFLPAPDRPDYLATLEELVHIELEMAWQAAARPASETEASIFRPPLVEAYLERFPCLNQPSIVRRLLQQERLVRHHHGSSPAATEYQERFP